MTLAFTQSVTLSAPPLAAWQALLEPAKVEKYHLAQLKEVDLREGGRICYGTAEEDMIMGKIVRVEPGRRLEHTFRFLPGPMGTGEDLETLVSYVLEATDAGTLLTLTHSGFPCENQTFANISGGWPCILENLQAYLERER